MSESWKQWEGHTIDGKFRLQSYLGGSEHSAVFLTQLGADASQQAVIKFMPARAETAAAQFSRWERASKLAHPALLRVFGSGRCELGDARLLYVVSEYAEENLAQILPERALTPEEARGMLSPVLQALEYLHGAGLVHGHVKPSNICAIGDQVKLPGETVRVAGEARGDSDKNGTYDPPETTLGTKADVWSLGATLVEVLTQRAPVWDRRQGGTPTIPANMPEPFREIAGHCLVIDPAKRCTVAEILAQLEPAKVEAGRTRVAPAAVRAVAPPSPVAGGRSAKWWPAVLVLVALGVVGLVLIARSRTPSTVPQAPPEQVQSEVHPAAPAAAPHPGSTREKKPSPSTGSKSASKAAPPGAVVKGTVAHQVMPQVAPAARDTIEGKVRVRVRVQVDAAGNVTEASFDSAGPSKYFARLALEAAQQWKFTPAQVNGQAVASEWMVKFAFGRTETEVYPAETAP